MEFVAMAGRPVPVLGLGTWQMRGRQCREAVETALELGYRHLDTAQMYDNEEEVGAAITASGVSPADLFVTTKIASHVHTRAEIRASTEESLGKLGIDRVDLLLLHQPVAERPLAAALGEMVAMRDEAMVGWIGVSNFSLGELAEAMEAAPIAAIQLEYHPFRDQTAQRRVAEDHTMLFQAYSPLARGRGITDPTVAGVAARLGATPAQVMLRWLADQPQVAPIPKAASRAHLEENWAALDVVLDDEARSELDALTARERSARDV